MAKGTLRAILCEAGINVNEFLKAWPYSLTDCKLRGTIALACSRQKKSKRH
jgi:hypothetical protein